MKLLVALANHGIANDVYLGRVLEEYRGLPYDVHIVVLSNISKDLGADIEVVVHVPKENPYAFPFAHKKILADRVSDYDAFIYSEDDTLITKRNIEAFLKVTDVLPKDKIGGFLNIELGPDGSVYFVNANLHYHWSPDSVETIGQYAFAYFSNVHSASYILTRQHLRRAIESGGFLVGPHEGRYQLRESAATDPYTQCGFKKVICLSHLDDFLIRHLPGIKFADRPFTSRTEFQKQIDALLAISKNGRPRGLLFDPETKVPHTKWSKDYYEPVREGVVSLLPAGVRSVLSIGCGWGATEGHLVKKGLRVVGVPMDPVIAACAEAKGVKIVQGDFHSARNSLAGERFDCILFCNVLHLVPEPLSVLSSFVELLSHRGVAIVTTPNFAQITTLYRRIRREPAYKDLGDYGKTGFHMTTPATIRKWFELCGLALDATACVIPERGKLASRLSLGLADSLLAEELTAVGRRR